MSRDAQVPPPARAGDPPSGTTEDTAGGRGYHHGDLRRSLLEAARQLIVERGVPGTSLREIARVAGVSNRAPYHHFSDKLCLLAEVAREGFSRLEERMGAGEAATDPADRLTRLGVAYLEFAHENPGDFQTMYWDELCDLTNFPDRMAAAEGPFRCLLDALQSAADRPVPAAEMHRIALIAWSLVHGLARLRAQGVLALAFPDEDVSALVDDVVAQASRMLVAELQRTP